MMASDTIGDMKIGHVIAVKPDEHVWGSKEVYPAFYQINITGMSVEEACMFMEQKWDTSNPDEPILLGSRNLKFNSGKLPGSLRNKLDNDGGLTITAEQVMNFFDLETQ